MRAGSGRPVLSQVSPEASLCLGMMAVSVGVFVLNTKLLLHFLRKSVGSASEAATMEASVCVLPIFADLSKADIYVCILIWFT